MPNTAISPLSSGERMSAIFPKASVRCSMPDPCPFLFQRSNAGEKSIAAFKCISRGKPPPLSYTLEILRFPVFNADLFHDFSSEIRQKRRKKNSNGSQRLDKVIDNMFKPRSQGRVSGHCPRFPFDDILVDNPYKFPDGHKRLMEGEFRERSF